MANIGESIRSLRKSKGMTQDELAEQLHMTRQTVSNYENGKSEPDIEMLVRLAEVFETDVNSLVDSPAALTEDKVPKHWGKAAILIAVTIGTFILSHYMTEWANEYGGNHYNLSFIFAVVGFFSPILWAVLGYTVIYTLQQFARFPEPIPQYKLIHRLLLAFLIVSCALYLPQVLWCCAELLRLAGLLPIEGKLPVCNITPAYHFWFIARYPKVWYTVCALCGGGIAITKTKTPEVM